MLTMRTIDEAYYTIKESDPNTALTKTGLRKLVVSGEIPSVRVGKKYLVAIENISKWSSSSSEKSEASVPPVKGIRKIEC